MKIAEIEPKTPPQPEVKFGRVSVDACPPEGNFYTSNLIEFFAYEGKWQLPAQPRMDSTVRKTKTGLEVVEMNKLKAGDEVILSQSGKPEDGIFITSLNATSEKNGEFAFMSSTVSPERPVDYSELAQIIKNATKLGEVIWVLGPAVVHARAIEAMSWMIKNGYVGAILGGNAVAVHDLEHSIFRTSLGMNDKGNGIPDGHRTHMDTITAIKRAGSIKEAVEKGVIKDGIMYECVQNKVPFVLAGSIRDDGPLPDTITDAIESQNAMREHTIKASCVVMLATALHSIATGNMTPTYMVRNDEILPVPVICVDKDEFTISKLADRGTAQAYPVVGNVREVVSSLAAELKL